MGWASSFSANSAPAVMEDSPHNNSAKTPGKPMSYIRQTTVHPNVDVESSDPCQENSNHLIFIVMLAYDTTATTGSNPNRCDADKTP